MTEEVHVIANGPDEVVIQVAMLGAKGDKGDKGEDGLTPSTADLDQAVALTQGYRSEAQASAQSALDASASAAQAADDATIAANTAVDQAGIATEAASTATTQAGIATGAAETATERADTATAQAGIASGAASNATAQAGAATAAASTATTQAGIATTKASEAAASAAAAIVAKITWRGAWITGMAYAASDAVEHNGSSYVVEVAHTAGPTTEPGAGASWATVWGVLAEKGAQGDPGPAGPGGGDVMGPATAINDRIAVFDGTTGKLLKVGGVAISGLATAAQGALAATAMQPGAFGLGDDAIGSLDFNAIEKTGFYSGDSSTANRPGGNGNWLLTHIARVVGPTGQAIQLAVARADSALFDPGEIWTRARLDAGTWSPWVRSYNSGNIAALAPEIRTALNVEAAAYINPRRNPSWHGAVGGADDSATIQAWLNWVVENNQAGELPSNMAYNLGSLVSVSHAGRNFRIVGQGSRSSRFRVTSNAGGIRINSTSRNTQARLEGFGMIAAGAGGVGFECSMPEGGMRDHSTLEAEDLATYGDDWGSGDTKYFQTGLALKGHFDAVMQNLRHVGPGALAGYGPASARFLAAKGIDLEGCYDFKLLSPRVQNAQVGISVGIFQGNIISAASALGTTVITLSAPTNVFTSGFQVRIMDASNPAMNGSYWAGPGANQSQVALWQNAALTVPVTFPGTFTGKIHQQAQAEAIQIDDGNINSVLTAIDVFRPFLAEPTLWMNNNHINAIENGFTIDGATLFNLTNNNFLSVTNPADWPAITPRDIWLKNGSKGLIALNTFESVYDARRHTSRINIDIERDALDSSSGNNIRIAENVFTSSLAQHAVRVASVVGRVHIADNDDTAGSYTKTYELNNSWGRNTVQRVGGRVYSDLNAVPPGDTEGKFEVTATNKPGASNSAGIFKQFQWSDTERTMEAHLFFPSGDANKIFTRVMSSGTWGAWVEK